MADKSRLHGTLRILILFGILSPHTAQVAFMMSKGTIHPIYNRYISFNNVVTAYNAHVLPEFGAFAPNVSGLYQFTFSAATRFRSPFRISLKRAQETVATLYGSFSDYQQVAQSVVLQLDPEQYVYPYVELGDIFESPIDDRIYTIFSGFLISQLPMGTFQPQQQESSPGSSVTLMNPSTGPRYVHNSRVNYSKGIKGFRTIVEQSLNSTDNESISTEP